MKKHTLYLAAAACLAACGTEGEAAGEGNGGAVASAAQPADSPAPATEELCSASGGLRPLPDDVHESSGVAVSRTHSGIFWTHNDSGEPELFAVGADGRLAARVRVTGAEVEDWEDVAVGPCPGGGDCLYIADIGDNDAARSSVTVYRVPEPAPGGSGTAPAEAIRLRYPDGAHDAEAMFVLPDGRIYLVTKGETGPVTLYRAPTGASSGEPTTLERVRELAGGKVGKDERITGADASRDGRWIAVRTVSSLALYPAEDFLGGGTRPPRRMELASLGEAQGEGVGFTPEGGLVLTSEGGKKKDPATFARLECALQ